LRREVDAGNRTHAFYYNGLYELTAESHPDFGTISYTLDPNGNRTQKRQGGVTEWASYDTQNKLLWTNQAGNFPPASGQAAAYRLYQYDPNGQPVQIEKRSAGGGVVLDQLDWDGMRKLRRLRCQGQERYTAEYDSSGARVRSRLYGVDHLYSYGAGLLHDEAGNTVYTPGVSQRREGADAYFHADWIGSTRYLTNSTGLTAPTAYRFDAYGRLSAAAGPDVTSSKFAGGHGYENDAPGGLQLLGARYYDPAVGRFLNPDPIGFLGGLNLYEYCFGNPVGMVDPTGLQVRRYPPGYFPDDPDNPALNASGSVDWMYQAWRERAALAAQQSSASRFQPTSSAPLFTVRVQLPRTGPDFRGQLPLDLGGVPPSIRVIRQGQIHHIATNKHSYYAPRFEAVFAKANRTLEDDINKMLVPGHRGKHPREYHEMVERRLIRATEDRSPGRDCQQALDAELERLRRLIDANPDILKRVFWKR
jgi:RHS repeat-associated protein